MPMGLLLKLRLFMEGIEVPIISAQMSTQPNAPAQCNIQIPATDRAYEFKPRTLVHVFFYDFWEGPSDTYQAGVLRNEERQVETTTDHLQQTAEQRAEDEEYQRNLRNSATTTSNGAGTTSSSRALLDNPFPNAGSSSEASSTTPLMDNPFPSAGSPSAAGRIDSTDNGATDWTPPSPQLNPLAENPFENQDERWKLFFVGEVTGFQFTKNAMQRSIVLNCMDLSIYWDTCYQYKVNVASLTGDHMAAFVGAGTTFYDTFFASGMSYIVSAVTRRSVSQPNLSGLLSGVVRLLESVGGVYIGNEARDLYGLNPQSKQGRFKGVNDFFSIAELRLKLVYMITAAEGDESSRRHFRRRAFAMWGRRRASRLGKISSFREILNSMMQFIYHSCMPCPIARFQHPSERQQTVNMVQFISFANTRRGRQFAERLNWAVERADYIYDAMRGATEGTRLEFVSGFTSACTSLATTSAGLGNTGLTEALNTAKLSSKSLARRADGDYVRRNDETLRFSNIMRDRIRVAAGYLRSLTQRRRTRQTRSVHIGERLHSQIIKPDIFMCSPPRCNVIFPEHASQISFTRQYMREVTRMRLKVSDQIFGPDALLDRAYFAPDVEVMGALPPRRRHGRGSNAGQLQGRRLRRAAYSKRIMDHELYVGVIPVFETMNEVNLYAARTDLVTQRGARVPYAIRSVNHQFFKHRWAPRQMSVSGRFNPYFAPGFPTVVLDRYMGQEQLTRTAQRVLEAELLTKAPSVEEHNEDANDANFRTPPEEGSEEQREVAGAGQDSVWAILRENVPSQFVGLAEQVSHSINQSSASTSVSLTHARVHRENEELLGSNRVPLTRRSLIRVTDDQPPRRGVPRGRRRARAVEGRAIRTTVVAALREPQLGDIGPYMGEVIEVTRSEQTGFLPLYGPHFGDRPRRTWTRVPVGESRLPVEYGPEVVVQAGQEGVNERDRVTFYAYSVKEAIDRWRGQTVEVPLEDFIRPPWMSDVWRNDQIGSTYQQFFGTGAVTDATVIDAGQALMSANELDPTSDAASAANLETDANNQGPVSQNGIVQRPGMTITIERAIDLLVRMYSLLRHTPDADIHEFVRAYTWRPVATLTDILGSRDLTINEQGVKEQGTEGLHSRAFGRGELGQNLRNLVDEEVEAILDVNVEEDRGNVLRRMDKRAEKSEAVMRYVSELYDSRGLLG